MMSLTDQLTAVIGTIAGPPVTNVDVLIADRHLSMILV
jgi:hypothetical protein